VLAGDRYIGLGVKEERVPVDGDRIPMWISEV
jgi:hypothetical protein